jgi:mRNA interferase MazF
MQTGDILLIPFPFSELNNIKVRPAIVIAETKDKHKDLIVAAISSKVPSTPSQNEIIINPAVNNGLRVISVIKVDRIFTLKSEKMIAAIGRVNEGELRSFQTIFKSLVD